MRPVTWAYKKNLPKNKTHKHSLVPYTDADYNKGQAAFITLHPYGYFDTECRLEFKNTQVFQGYRKEYIGQSSSL